MGVLKSWLKRIDRRPLPLLALVVEPSSLVPFLFLPSVTLVQYLWTGKLFFLSPFEVVNKNPPNVDDRVMTLLFSDILPHTHCNFIVSVQYFLPPTPLGRVARYISGMSRRRLRSATASQSAGHAARGRRGQTPHFESRRSEDVRDLATRGGDRLTLCLFRLLLHILCVAFVWW